MRIAPRILILVLGLSAGGALLGACDSGGHDDPAPGHATEEVAAAAAAAKARAAAAYRPHQRDAPAAHDGPASGERQ